MTPITAGAGKDVLQLTVSGTPYQGVMPDFTVSVDGKQVGGTFTAAADHFQQQTGIVELRGDWGPGAHAVQVHFLNDAWNQAADWSNPAAVMSVPGNDRNLFVESMAYNGQALQGATGGLYQANGQLGTFKVDTTAGTVTAAQPATAATTADLAASHAAAAALVQSQPSAADVAALDAGLADFYRENGITAQDLAAYNAIAANPEASIQKAASGAFAFNGMNLQLQSWEDFTSGNVGAFTNLWGDSGIRETEGLVSRAMGEDGFSGAMMPAAGAGAGLGYGMYFLFGTLQTEAAARNGSYFVLWPSDDLWPGSEMDLAEILPDGRMYGTLHWAKDGVEGQGGQGNNGFDSVVYEGVDPKAPHIFWADWQPGSLTFGVDGKAWKTWTDHVPQAFADGGTNTSPGLGNKFEGFANAGALQGFAYATHTTADTGVTATSILGTHSDTPLT